MPNKKYLIVVGGPTASGKTRFAIRLARHFHTEIISADSRQFYQELNIGTAKPTPEERDLAPHHLIDHLSIEETYNVGQFESDALQLSGKLFQKYDILVLVGGSGLYIKALCEGLDKFPEVPPEIRKDLETFYEKKGLQALQNELAKVDPSYFAEVDINNPHRLIRALAVCRVSGQPFSSFRKNQQARRPFHPIYLQMQWPRPQLYERINQRVESMIQAGLVEEAKNVLPHQEHDALQTVGYQELFEHFVGKTTLEEAIELIKRNSRRYAKRQLTWNRRDGFWKHLNPDDFDLAIAYIDLARHQGFRIQDHSLSLQEQQPDLPKVNTPTTSKWLGAWQGNSLRLALLKESFSKTTCFSRFMKATGKIAPEEIMLFAHETAMQTEDQEAFLIIPPAVEPFFLKYGFQHTTLADLPGRLSSRWTALQKLEGLSLLRKPAVY